MGGAEAVRPRKLCASTELRQGESIRFELAPLEGRFGPVLLEGFALRTDAGVRGYLNLCPHRGQPVDTGDGRLFVAGALECQAHGARFDPVTGRCTGGPCDGSGLSPLHLEEDNGAIWLVEAGDPLDDGVG